MDRILTAAQIGCGKFAWSQDFPNMTNHPGVRLKWACDVNRENAEKAAAQNTTATAISFCMRNRFIFLF